MVSSELVLPDVSDYLYSYSMGLHEQPTNVGPRVGIVCSNMMFLQAQYGLDYHSEFFTLHRKNIGGMIVSESGIPHSERTTRKIRHVGKFDEENNCTLAFQGVGRAVLGSARFRLYYGTAVRLMSDDEHRAYLDGYIKTLAWLEDIEDYNKTLTTVAMLYHHTPFWDEVGSLTDLLLEKGRMAKHESLAEHVLECASSYRKLVG